MTPQVKICGITRAEDALLAEELGASAIGFVFYRKSPRYLSPADAGKISEKLGPFTTRVGVFVDEEPDNLKRIVETAHLTVVQLHGSERPEHIKWLKGLSVIKAFRVNQDFDCEELRRYNASAFLLDTYHADVYGGTGLTFDWKIAYRCRNYGRIILAGGLNPSNVNEAVKAAQPWGVDVSSGIESSPGIKDQDKMRVLFKALYKEK